MATKHRGRAPSRYVYPFGPKTTVGRIDQGQDFGGSGPVRAIGNARIIKAESYASRSGEAYQWGGVLYQLLSGPAKGRYIYTYEGVEPSVRAGQVVRAGQPIGTIIPGTSTGIETGWSDAAGVPISHSEWTPERDNSGYQTVGGKSFAAFLSGLAKGGGGGGGRSAYEKSLIAGGKTPAEARKLAEEEDAGSGGVGLPGEGFFEKNIGEPGNEAIEGAANAIKGGISLTESVVHALEHPETLMLNIGLVGGGAFLVYLGAMKILGVHRPPIPGPLGLATKGA